MESLVFAAPVPGAIEFGLRTGGVCVVGLFVALVLLSLAVRAALGHETKESDAPRMRVVEGGKEPRRRAA